jgi:hypothetical protein
MDARTVAALHTAGLSEEDQAKVIAALDSVTTEPPVGTVLRNPATGDVAVYVRQYAETYYRIVSPDDRNWVESEALVGWDALHKPAVESVPAPEVDPDAGTKN